YYDAARALLAHPELHALRAERGDLAAEYAESASWQAMVHHVWAAALQWASERAYDHDSDTCGCGCDCAPWPASAAQAPPGHARAPSATWGAGRRGRPRRLPRGRLGRQRGARRGRAAACVV